MSVKIKIVSALVLCAVVFSLSACAVRLDPPREITSVEEAEYMGFKAVECVDKIKVGSYGFLKVDIKLDYEDEVKWFTNNPAVAVVDSNGRVDGVKEGKATITAKAKSATIDYEIEVIKADKETLSYSTAFTANQEYLRANKEKKNQDLYALIVNEYDNSVTAYTYVGVDYIKPVRAMVCSTGKSKKTIKNDDLSYIRYNIGEKSEWVELGDGKYGRYATKISDDYSFMSTPYSDTSPNALIAENYNNIGKSVSTKNVLLSVADAKWIYDNCNEGTLVRVVNSDNTKGYAPLGVPKGMKLTENSKSLKWDPTDSSKDNPYSKLKPVISGVSDAYIEPETGIDLLKDIKAIDTCGNDITGKITIDGTVNVNVEGKYIVSYYVTDNMGRTARVDRKVVVTTDEKLLTTAPLAE